MAIAVGAWFFCLSTVTVAAGRAERFEFRSYVDVAGLFEQLNYTEASWKAGVREVPRVFLADIPPRWRDSVSSSVTVKVKKQIFFRTLAPLVLLSNESIRSDRARLAALRAAAPDGRSRQDAAWLSQLAYRYGVTNAEDAPVSSAEVDELWTRVDTIPVSLALSQAAEESGWGTSRFAAQGNAIFGQWTWGSQAMKPKEQRTNLGNYGIRAFDAPFESVAAYMLNLNSHPAYAKLRAKRADLRANGQQPTGWILAETLDRYSERGEKYVKSLHSLMRVNRLGDTDKAHLANGPDIILVPVGEGAAR